MECKNIDTLKFSATWHITCLFLSYISYYKNPGQNHGLTTISNTQSKLRWPYRLRFKI